MIRLIKPYVAFEEVESEFREVFETGWFTKGRFVAAFQDALQRYTDAEHAFLTTSATTALSLSLRVIGVQAGDEVIVSDFSFPATANVVEDLGAIPVFADVSPTTFNMLPSALEARVTGRTKAVIFVDALGNPSGVHEVAAICRQRGLPLIEDAACAIGSAESEVRCGNVADLTCFSFHPRKLLTTGEGGAITCKGSSYAERLATKLNHGAVVTDGRFDFVDFGFNYRLSELQAVMGIKQIAKLDSIVEGRNLVRDSYVDALNGLGFVPQALGADVLHNVQSLVFKVPPDLDRDVLIRQLAAEDIESTIGTYCLSGLTYYRNKYDDVQPTAEALERTTITLPCYDGVDVARVTGAIRRLAAEVR